MKTSIYIKLFALLSILAVLATAKDTKAPKATKSPKGTKSPKAGKTVTVDDFENPDKIITVVAEPLWRQRPQERPRPEDRPCDGEGDGDGDGEGVACPPVVSAPVSEPEPKIASITEFGKKDLLAAIAEQKFPIQRGPIGIVCTCPPYAAIFICIGFRSCDGCCGRVYEVDEEVA